MRSRPRLWPGGAVVALLAGALTWIWLLAGADRARQSRVVATLAVVLAASFLLLVWWVLFSNLSRRVRLAGVLGAALAAATAAATFTVRGLTGDLVPIVAFRWGGPSAVEVPLAAPSLRPRPSATAGPSAAPSVAGTAASSPSTSPSPPFSALRADFPQFLGPGRDGTVPEARLARDWKREAPRRLWRRGVGEGWSGFAVAGGLAVTQEQHGPEERVAAYDVSTGRPAWVHSDATRYETFIGGTGPRATPTIAGGRVFTMGATGILNALDLASGRRWWTRDVLAENGAKAPEWGKSCSPLVVDGKVVVSAGGPEDRSLVAYDAGSGRPLWSGGRDRAGYSSPVLMELAGRPQVVILNARTVAGHDPDTGRLLWEHPWPPGSENVASPVRLSADRVLVSTGYGIGSKLLRIVPDPVGALRAELLWESPRLKSKFANLIVHEGWIYGLDDGVLTCLDPATGERKWKSGRFGHGQLLLAGGLLVVQTEEGEVVLVDPSPEGVRELGRFAALDGKTWNPPALAGEVLVVRNHREAAAYVLPAPGREAAGR
ncbi:MAG TPA: PQQ-binding-like beta-propeller repeat protein [Vicinamibacteria bacterium]|nr:PQQ-binding-like beta-propeller repeat protein [Vicinamibacteria bacterium]